ncbi:polysaccharide biosynthesis protein [Priestia flexa]|uniref:polysaccharide biosynthesis protein n=1 Tax=Priestia flexa TaxID=86664 RepID=UPI0010FC05B4|nr:nucleoside-diphosphate sugar epimerase/dehydratase [Priestia flexa]QCS53928.1 polysaccharide biosynthesis protein [Priestia flexa]
MTYKKRLSLLMLLDSFIVLGSIYVSYFILVPNLNLYTTATLTISAVTLFVTHHLFAYQFHLYKKAWEYASIHELTLIFKAVTLSILCTAIIQFIFIQDIYFRTLGIAWMMHLLLIGGVRLVWRMKHDWINRIDTELKPTLIIGAGAAGTMVAKQLKQDNKREFDPVAFVDDDKRKHKLEIVGLPVLGGKEVIKGSIEKFGIQKIIIAIPSLRASDLQDIYTICKESGIKAQIIPKIEDVMVGKLSVNQFRDVEVEDLLGREPIQLNISSISEYVKGKTVLVTGAGGSIGSEICRQICKFNPKKLILVGHGENSIYHIEMELRNKFAGSIEVVPMIGDIQDRSRMFEIMEEYQPNVVYHAAAHKHVPLMEYNPKEAVKNNVIGTKNVADAADTFNVDTFVLISSDKAVNPTNVMGSTKRIAEMIIQQLDRISQTKFVAVRFGNVLGSRGSVIPLFKKQIKQGGPITVTDPKMTRYFMTIPEASRLVIQAGALANGGEVFVLDMGEPVKIVDLAKNLIRLSGYSSDEIKIEYSGIRPGEKMYEELLNDEEVHDKPIFPKIFIGKAVFEREEEVDFLVEKFETLRSHEVKTFVLNLANKKENIKQLVSK